MTTGQRQIIHLYLGRHKTTASGLWIYGKTVLKAILGFIESLEEAGLKTPLLRVSYGGDEYFEKELLDVLGGHHVEVELRPLPTALKSRRLSMIADLFRRSGRATLVHGTANLIPLSLSAKRVLTLHDILQAWSPVPASSWYVRLRRLFYTILLRLQCRYVHAVLTDQDQSREELEHRLKCAGKIRVVYPPLEQVYLETPLPEQKEPSRDFLAFASRDPRKNIDSLLLGFAAWPAHKEWRLRIISNSEEMTGHLRNLADAQGIMDCIEFLSGVPQWEMPLLYESSHALLFPSVAEGFGYPVYEALSQGTIVLCARDTIIGPLAEYVRNSIVECHPLTPPAIARALDRAASLRVDSENRAIAAEAVRTALSEEFMTRELMKLYRRLAPGLFESRIL